MHGILASPLKAVVLAGLVRGAALDRARSHALDDGDAFRPSATGKLEAAAVLGCAPGACSRPCHDVGSAVAARVRHDTCVAHARWRSNTAGPGAACARRVDSTHASRSTQSSGIGAARADSERTPLPTIAACFRVTLTVTNDVAAASRCKRDDRGDARRASRCSHLSIVAPVRRLLQAIHARRSATEPAAGPLPCSVDARRARARR